MAFEGFDPANEPRREALLTLANGYMGVRGAASEFPANDVHYPGTYLAGVFNRVQSNINGRDAEHESMVNTPNWLHLDLRFAEGEWWSEGGLHPSKEHVALDLRRGLLTRTLTLSDPEPRPDGSIRSLDVVQRRLVSLRHRHLGAQETTLIPHNYTGRLHVRTGIDPTVTNSGVAEYKELNSHHLMLLESTTLPDEHETLLSLVRTTQSKIEIAMAQRTRVESEVPSSERREVRPGGIEFRRHLIQVSSDQPVIIDSTTAVVTGRDAAISSPREAPWPSWTAPRSACASCWHRTRSSVPACGTATRSRSTPPRTPRNRAAPSWPCAPICSTPLRRWHRTCHCATPAYPPVVCTARATAATSSGTSCSSCPWSICATRM